MKLLKHPDTFLRGPTEKIEFPLSDENKIIIKNHLKRKRNTKVNQVIECLTHGVLVWKLP